MLKAIQILDLNLQLKKYRLTPALNLKRLNVTVRWWKLYFHSDMYQQTWNFAVCLFSLYCVDDIDSSITPHN